MKKTGILVINETAFIIDDGLTFIGRDPVTCSIILANVTISKQHALAIKINDNFYISDLQSSNGTKLEEVSLQPRFCYEIIDNATLTFGDVKCKFIIQEYNAIFKTPTALSKKSAASSKVSLNTTKLPHLSTNIHKLPTQLEAIFQDCTQQILDKSVEETQILESLIIETPNISKIRSNISRTKNKDDFIIPETQSENFYQETQKHYEIDESNNSNISRTKNKDDFIIPETQSENSYQETQKHYEIDESNNSDQFELSNLEISDTQMAEVHDSIIQSPSKHKNFISKRKQSDKIHNLETQNINEAETQLEFDSPKASNTRNLPTQNLASSASSKTLNIYEMETQQFEETSPSSKKHLHEAETQVDTPQFRKPQKPSSANRNIYEAETQVDIEQFEEPQKPSSPDRNIYEAETQVDIEQFEKPQKPSSHNKNIYEAETQVDTQQFKKSQKPSSPSRNIYEAETQVDTEQFEKPHKPSSHNRNIYEAETQILNSEIEIPKIKIISATDSDLTSSKNSETQLLEDRIDLNSGEPHAENENLIETQFEFDAEPNIETPKLKQVETTHMEEKSEEIRDVKRVIGKNRAINFTQDNSQIIESQSEPEMPGMKKHVIGNSKPINFTESPTVQIDLNETQFDEFNIPEIQKQPKKSLNSSSFFSDSDSSLNSSFNSSIIRNIIKILEPASKNTSNTSTLNRSSVEDRSGSFVSHKINKSVETVPNDVFVEIESNSVSNCLNDNISNTSVQHKAFYKTKTVNKVVEELKDNEISLTDTPKSTPSTSKTVENFDTIKKPNLDIDNMLDDSTSQPSVSKSSNTVETDDIFDIPTQALETGTNISPNKQAKKTSQPGVSKSSKTVNTDDIFDIPTQALETGTNISPNKQGKKTSQPGVSKSSNTVETNDIFDIPTQTLETGTNISSNKQAKKTSQPGFSTASNTVETNDIFDVPTQAFETVKKNSPKAFDTNISQLSEKLLHDEDLENILNNDPKTPEMCNLAASSSTGNLSINKKPAKQRTRKPSESSTRKMTRKDSDNDNKVLERLEMVVMALKEVINTKINDKNQSDRADVGQTSSNRPTRNSRKRSDAATETLERKKRKTSNNKQKLVEVNNNTNNEKLINKQKSEEVIKLTRKTTNQQATDSTHDPTVEVSSTRPVRKSKTPFKFRMDSQSEESCVERSSRKRGHPLVPEQSSSESIDSAISSKIQKLGTNCKPTRSKFQVIFTIFRDGEQEQTVKKLGGKLVKKSKDANVLVTNQISRSVKLLNAISQGIPIVSPRWLDVCKHAKNFVDPWDYLLDDLEAEKRFKFRLKDSLNIAKENGLLFQGYKALLTKSIPTDLKDILQNAGAKCISSWPKKATDKHIIVSSMEDKSQWPKQSKVIIVSAEAIFSAVVLQKIDLKNY
ncbi:titin-like, partial [Chrysoperla carnea]|uniref:titin-like n=1 Tax=Chrysoperla carnea TaxID=189513 RepID=UPI001D083D3D